MMREVRAYAHHSKLSSNSGAKSIQLQPSQAYAALNGRGRHPHLHRNAIASTNCTLNDQK